MGNIGPEKLMLLFLVALIVLGPARLPEAARTIGKVVGELRRLSGDFRAEVRDALFDPVADARNALLPSNWDGSVVAEPSPGAAPSSVTMPTAAASTTPGPSTSPAAPATPPASPSDAAAALPLPDDPSLN